MTRNQDSSHAPSRDPTRRDFLKQSGVAAGAAFAAALPPVHPGGDHTIRLALIGCGGRGSGAAGNALSAPGGPVELHAMADLFEDKMSRSYRALESRFGRKVNVPGERKFLGFDAYRHAIDCLRPGDIALCTTHAYCRPTHVEYAVQKGVHVFMEKSFAPDPAGLHRMLRVGEQAEKKNVKIAAGLMCRHSPARQALIQKVRDGELGEIQLVRAYRMSGGRGLGKRRRQQDELTWQIRHAGFFTWVSSGRFIEWLIHQIDECCWVQDAWPVAAHGMGGRAPNSADCSQNLDIYAIEYSFANGTKAMVDCRFMNRCYGDFSTYVQGTRRSAQFSGKTHAATVHTYKDRRVARNNIDWSAPKEPATPWQAEWNVLLDDIRHDRPHNETDRAVRANFAAIMGRAAVHTGQIVTWDQVRSSSFQFCDSVDDLGFDSPPPVRADAEGRYPVPIPGEWQEL